MSESNQVDTSESFSFPGAQFSVVFDCHVLQVQLTAHVCEHWIHLRDCEEVAVRLWYSVEGLIRCRLVWRVSLFSDCMTSCRFIHRVPSSYWRGDADSDGGEPAVLFRFGYSRHVSVEANLPVAPH